MRLFQRSVPEPTHAEAFAVFDQAGHVHPGEPHWYLPVMGIDPAQRGRGYGSALLRAALEVCDRDSQLAYLESSSPRTPPLYARHGFRVLCTIQVGSSPPIFPMVRPPR
jgi:GNAT superfamily N-acetyltransferase